MHKADALIRMAGSHIYHVAYSNKGGVTVSKLTRIILILALLVVALPVLPVGAQGPALVDIPELPGCQGTVLASGARIAICMPTETTAWNGDLVIFAHGYVAPGGDPRIPIEQLLIEGISVPQMVTSMGYAFAVTSYRTNGLSIKNGVDDLVDLQQAFATYKGTPSHSYVVGVSEGGLVTTLAIEKRPDVFSGGLACCGPVGDFQKQMDYFGDFRVVYDYFFPQVLLPYGGSAMDVPAELIQAWQEGALPATIIASLAADSHITEQLLKVTKVAYDPNDLSTISNSVLEVLTYDVFATMDAIDKLGGIPFNNKAPATWYYGSDNDKLLNRSVARFKAARDAVREMDTYYNASGKLTKPLVTMHTTGDPVVPYWQEVLYRVKTVSSHSGANHLNIPIVRYGHCNFTASELIFGFGLVVYKATGSWPTGINQALPTAELQQQFNDLKANQGKLIKAAE
ncbi:MAG: S9 family peptidase [Chloroflexi bacterium]|nr:S9 family peptidase [Chloroflexota bacterium]